MNVWNIIFQFSQKVEWAIPSKKQRQIASKLNRMISKHWTKANEFLVCWFCLETAKRYMNRYMYKQWYITDTAHCSNSLLSSLGKTYSTCSFATRISWKPNSRSVFSYRAFPNKMLVNLKKNRIRFLVYQIWSYQNPSGILALCLNFTDRWHTASNLWGVSPRQSV